MKVSLGDREACAGSHALDEWHHVTHKIYGLIVVSRLVSQGWLEHNTSTESALRKLFLSTPTALRLVAGDTARRFA